MKKLIFTMTMVLITTINSYGKEVETQKTERFEGKVTNFQQFMKSNWFVSFGVGVEGRFNSIDEFNLSPVPVVDISIGKWLLPYTALRIQYNYSPIKGNTSLANSFVNQNPNGDMSGNISIIHADLIFSLMSIIDGYYNDNRRYDLMPFVGFGTSISHDKNTLYTKDYPVFGLINNFKLTNELALNLEIRTSPANAGHYGMTNSGHYRDRVIPLSATVGVTYRFKTRRWTIRAPYADYPEVRVFEMNEYIPERKEIIVQKEIVRDTINIEKVVKEVYMSSNIIFFELDKYNITKQNRVRLSYIAKVINDIETNQIFTITGFADEITGSSKHNVILSKNRAEAVYDVLVKEFKVDKRKLRIDYKGGVGDMFYNDNVLSRCVIIQ